MTQACRCITLACDAWRSRIRTRPRAKPKAEAWAVAALLFATLTPALAMFCTPLGSGGLVIGHYQPLQATPLDTQASFAIECIPAVPGESLNMNVRLPSAGSGRLHLGNLQAGTQGAGTLTVDLYRDAARQVPLDEQVTINFRDRPLIPTRYTVSLFARVPPGQDADTGHYHLPLTIVIDY